MRPGVLRSHESGEKQTGTGGLMGQGDVRAACSFLHTDFCLEESPIWQESDVWKYWWWETLGLSQAAGAFVPPVSRIYQFLGAGCGLKYRLSEQQGKQEGFIFSPGVCCYSAFSWCLAHAVSSPAALQLTTA